MTSEKAVETLRKIKVYATGADLEALDMAIESLIHDYVNGVQKGLEIATIKNKGEWIDDEPDINDWSYKKGNLPRHCSVCGHRAGKYKYKTYKFCPWCGADMRGESE